MKKKIILFLLGTSLFPLFPEEVTVTEVNFDVYRLNGNGKRKPGVTREWALRGSVETAAGQTYTSLSELERQVDDDVQELTNQQLFVEVSAEIMKDAGGAGRIVIFSIEDSISFLPLPFVTYDSNIGLTPLYLQLYNNAFGTMVNTYLEAGISIGEGSGEEPEITSWFLSLRLGNMVLGPTTNAFQFTQKGEEIKRYNGETLTGEQRFLQTRFFWLSELRFGAERDLYYSIGPYVDFRYDYEAPTASGDFRRLQNEVSLEQGFFYDTVDYLSTMRSGFKGGMSNRTGASRVDDQWQFTSLFMPEAAVYLTDKSRRINYIPRLSAVLSPGLDQNNLGESLRGVRDATAYGEYAFYLQQTFAFSVFPDSWRENFDLQLLPFYDAGWIVNDEGSAFRHGTGLEIYLIWSKAVSLPIKFTWGFDLDPEVSWDSDNKMEFSFLLGASY